MIDKQTDIAFLCFSFNFCLLPLYFETFTNRVVKSHSESSSSGYYLFSFVFGKGGLQVYALVLAIIHVYGQRFLNGTSQRVFVVLFSLIVV